MPRRFLLRLFAAAAPAGDHVPDGELLRRFVSSQDSSAFELIVRRHADAVWTAGFRILGNEADAEDVFQATFLALFRKAGAIRGTCVGGWLHRVAVNAALKVKAKRAPGINPGVDPDDTPGLTPGARPEIAELAAVVHDELARLPDRYRLPVVLCDLEGQSHADAAKSLGWPIGSVSGRLSRARDILRDRLTRRGFAAPAAVLVATAAPGSAINAATAIALGAVPASPIVSSLTEGVLSAMRLAKLKLTAAVVAATGFVALAGTGAVYALVHTPTPGLAPAADPQTGADAKPPVDDPAKSKPVAHDFTAFPDLDAKEFKDMVEKCPNLFSTTEEVSNPKDAAARQLLKAMVNNARTELRLLVARVNAGTELDPKGMSEAAERVSTAVVSLDPAKALALAEERVRVMKWFEKIVDVRVRAGSATNQELHRVRYDRLNAELQLTRVKAAPGGKAPAGTGPVRP